MAIGGCNLKGGHATMFQISGLCVRIRALIKGGPKSQKVSFLGRKEKRGIEFCLKGHGDNR